VVILIWLACGAQAPSEDPCAGRGDMVHSPGGLTVTAEEHGLGWEQETCFQCHQVWTIHQHDCVGGLDMDELRERTDPEDPSSCVACHGDNGVPSWSLDSAEAL
jgi:hypothetical protein